MSIHSLYEAVIDAGSSGTRIYLYQITLDTSYPEVTLLAQNEFSTTPSGNKEDGINNYIHPTQPRLIDDVCGEVIEPLLNSLDPYLQELRIFRNDVVVNLFATAGMRYAERHFGSGAVGDLYRRVKDFVAQSGFKVGEIRTADGNSEEGIWTWVNLNDVHRNIFNSSTSPLGVIEVGGSSAQLSFPVGDEQLFEDVYPIRINDREYRVFCKTYLGLGQDDARKMMRQSLGPVGSNVCFPKGFPSHCDLGDTLDGFGSLKLECDGGYDFDACIDCYVKLIADVTRDRPLPDIHKYPVEFVGIDGVFHALKFWNIQDNPTKLADQIKNRVIDCSDFENIFENEYVQAQSANATYIHALLFGVNGLLKDNPQKMISALPNSTDEGKTLTWTRGFLLLKYAST
ncbi:hypothetical protein [Zwartia vadi]|uniref:hypothetical protein n=1 Tax=Zwartia vadi TaxID=3058168 RepID=UPI0025B59551|nr:hypothetical protein [Zwartia vadi]MDN3987888.1 hypothetical protein [Zwartia vadi]